MAATGAGSRVSYKAESTFGTAPAASGSQYIRRVTFTTGLQRGTVQSAEVRSDRAISDYRLTNRSVAGDYTGELSITGQKDFLEHLAMNGWNAGVTTGALTTVTAAVGTPGTFTRSAGSYITDGFKVGDVIRWTGWAGGGATANNAKNYRITALTATVMTVAEAVVADAAGDSVTATVVGHKLLFPGTTKKSMSMEIKWADLDTPQYELFTGVRTGRGAFTFPPDGIVGFTFGLMGREKADLTGTEYFTSPTAEDTSSLLTFATGSVRLGGTDIATVTGLDFTVDNQMTTLAVGGSRYTPDVFPGRMTLNGTITALFENPTFPNAFANETELSLQVMMEAPGTTPAEFFNIVFPRIKIGGDNRPLNTEQGITITMPFVALLPTSVQTALNYNNSMMVVQRSLT